MEKKTKLMIGVGVISLVGAYFLFFKGDGKSGTNSVPNEDILDNPETGPYMGSKDRSVGNSNSTTTTLDSADGRICVPAMESEGGGKGHFISIDDPYTPKSIESERRKLVNDNLNVGDTIDLDGRSCKIDKFWVDSAGRKAAIACENHSNIVYNSDSKICW